MGNTAPDRPAGHRDRRVPAPQQAHLGNYTASVAISRHSPVAAITAPRGKCVVLLDYRSAEPLRIVLLADPGGVLVGADGSFVVSSGAGLVRIEASGAGPQLLVQHALHWDNHLSRA